MSFHTWNTAECSESAGRIFTLCLWARGRTKGPPAIRVSLLAKAMSFPASIAATVGYLKKKKKQKTIKETKEELEWEQSASLTCVSLFKN